MVRCFQNVMNTQNQNPDNRPLHALLRESRPAPGLPPRFQENVWHRIARVPRTSPVATWAEALIALLFRPRFAFATVAVLLMLGGFLGSLDGTAQARQAAQDRYLGAVVMNVSH